MLTVQEPQTLPEAYAFCLEFENLNFRNINIRQRNVNNSISSPINQIFTTRRAFNNPRITVPYQQLSTAERNWVYNNRPSNPPQPDTHNPPPRPTNPKPPTPMEVDRSIQTRQVDYTNRPRNFYPNKRSNDSMNLPRKSQHLHNLESQEQVTDPCIDHDQSGYYNVEPQDEPEESHFDQIEECEPVFQENQLNFMMDTCLAYYT
ncbi:unnamed protein product [Hermetia illucens]|uniref:Uncharacterized protein n=1 Tax=Hermetia illucens TaxID=343691 RepID=A0A7R8UJG6_HERIL|nr:unnamed protein product [Hermetia illucens]